MPLLGDATGQRQLETMGDDLNTVESSASEPLTEEGQLAILHSQFRTITMLLTLVSHTGHQLPKRNVNSNEVYQPALESSMPSRTIALNAIAALLVRDSEVVAAAACDPVPPPMRPMTKSCLGPPSELTPCHLFATLQEPDLEDMDFKDISYPLTGFTTIANPDKNDKPPEGHCLVATPGKSHWASINDNSWFGLTLGWQNRKRDPLSNHIATFSEYFKVYKITARNDRTGLFEKFTHYIVSCCWKKMRRRINHWSSQGFIYILGHISDQEVRTSLDNFTCKPPNRKDSALGSALVSLHDNNGLDGIMRGYRLLPGNKHETSKLPNLLAAFKEVLGGDSDGVTAYNRETCAEFHQLFVAVLFGYGEALAALYKAKHAKAAGVQESIVYQSAAKLWRFTHLLWRIAHSKMLHHHLAVLEAGEHLHIPKDDMKNIYSKHIPFVDTAGAACKDEDEDEDEDEDAEEEFYRLSARDLRSIPGNKGGLALAFQRWTRMHVSHFTALSILSSFSDSPGVQGIDDFHISLLAVRPPIKPNVLADWEAIIKNLTPPPAPAGAPQPLADAKPFNAQDAIDLLRAKFKDPSPGAASIIRSFGFQPPSFSGTVHCEAALASLAKYADKVVSQTSRFGELIKTLNQSTIAVSKLCCPVCRELLDILRGDTGDFKVRGCHSTIYPVELPSLLPIGVVREMVERFGGYLYGALTSMLETAKQETFSIRHHSRSHSFQSDSGLSVASDESGKHIMEP